MFKSLKEKFGKFFSKKEEPKLDKETPEKEIEKKLKSREDFSEESRKVEGNLKKEKKLEKTILIKEELKEENTEELEQAIEQVEEKIFEEPKKEESFLTKIRNKLKTAKLDQDTFNEFFEELESLLLENNVALEVVDQIKNDMEKDLINLEIKKSEIEEEIKKSLKESLEKILIDPFDIVKKIREKKEPFVILFFGINGAGKTTTIAKIAKMLQDEKITSVIAAGDTFRAASIEQLKMHGEKLGVKLVHSEYGSDPAAVGFDAISHAKSHGIKCVLIDTAGRMHTKSDLMREMEKIIRVCKPDLKIFIAESITGNDAVEQAKAFNSFFEIDGSILTKADVDEKGGTMISIGYVTKKPILFLGVGQEYKDLEPFNKKELLTNLGLD